MTEILADDMRGSLLNVPLESTPKDARAKGLQTLQELEVFNMSSNYQGITGGNSDLHSETGMDIHYE